MTTNQLKQIHTMDNYSTPAVLALTPVLEFVFTKPLCTKQAKCAQIWRIVTTKRVSNARGVWIDPEISSHCFIAIVIHRRQMPGYET